MARAKKKVAKKQTKRPARKVKKQAQIPGTERHRIPALSSAAEEYVEVRDSRMDWTKQEVKAKEKVLELMRENELNEYTDDELGIVVTIEETKTKVKVRSLSSADDEEEAAE